MPETTFSEAIKQATAHLLETDNKVIIVGLGADYKNGLDGTIGSIAEKFPDRVLDTPLSEAGNGGACVGMAINGLKPIFHNGRTEFALFAIDSIVTQASKWNYMFGGEAGSVPIVFRIAVGRAWGSGPQHSQALYPLWANCAGLKVVVPSTPQMARDLLYSATLDLNPVAYVEPRWLYNIKEDIKDEIKQIPLNKARIVKEGKDITIVTYAEGVHDALLASKELEKHNISVEVIDLVSINPVDCDTVFSSLDKTGRVLFVEPSNYPCSVFSEIMFGILAIQFPLKYVNKISCSHVPIPAATSLAEQYYLNHMHVLNHILYVFGKEWAMTKNTLSFSDQNMAPKTNISELL